MRFIFSPRFEEAGADGSSAGGGPAPGSLTANQVPFGKEPEPSADADVFAEMGEFAGTNGADKTVPETASPAAAAPPLPPPAMPAAAVQATVAPPQVAPAAPVAPAPQYQPAPPQAPQLTPAPPQMQPAAVDPQQQQLIQYQQVKEKAAAEIGAKYALTPEQEVDWMTSPNKVVGQIVGKMYVDIYEAVSQLVLGQIPQVSYNVIGRTLQAYEAEQQFFGTNPDLRQVPRDVLSRVYTAYIGVNPGVSQDVANREIGELIRRTQGIAPSPVAQPQPTAVPAAAQPQIVARTPIGGASLAAPPPAEPNIWEEMAAFRR